MKKYIIPITFFFVSLLSIQLFGSTPADPELIKKIETNIQSLLGPGRLIIKTTEQEKLPSTTTITGKADFCGIQDVDLTAKFNQGGKMNYFYISTAEGGSITPLSLANELIGKGGAAELYLPGDFLKKLQLDSYTLQFDAGGVKVTQLDMSYRLVDKWSLFPSLEIAMDKLTVDISVKTPLGASKKVSGGISGQFSWAGTQLVLNSNLVTDPKEWQLTGTLKDLSINDLITRFKIDDLANITLPDVIGGQGVNILEVNFKPFDRRVEFYGDATLGYLHVVAEKESFERDRTDKELQKEFDEWINNIPDDATSGHFDPTANTKKQDSKWVFMAGFALKEDFKFANLIPELEPMDAFQLNNIGIVISSSAKDTIDSRIPLFQNLGKGNNSIPKGFSFIVLQDLEKYKLGGNLGNLTQLTGIKSVIFRADVPPNLIDLSLEGIFALSEQVNLFEKMYLRNLKVGTKPLAGSPELDFKTDLAFVPDAKDTLEFTAGIVVKPVAMTGSLTGSMTNIWESPYGFKPLNVGPFSITAGLKILTGPPFVMPSDMILAGGIKIADFEGQAQIGVDVNKISNNMLFLEFNRIGMKEIVQFFTDGFYEKIPPYVREGIDLSLEEVAIELVPPGGQVSTVLRPEPFYPGFRLAGQANIIDWSGMMDITFEGFSGGLGGLEATARMDPIKAKIEDLTVFELRGANGEGKPTFHVNLTADHIINLQSREKIVYVNGGLTLLDVGKGDAFIELTPQGYRTTLSGKVFGLMEADLDARIEQFTQPMKNTYVKASVKPDFVMKKIQKLLSKEILGNAFNLDSMSFKGQLEEIANTGFELNVYFTLAGHNEKVKISIKPAKAGKFTEDIFNQIANAILSKSNPIIRGILAVPEVMTGGANEAKELAEKAAKAGLDEAIKAADQAEQTAQTVKNNYNELETAIDQKVNEGIQTAGEELNNAKKELEGLGHSIDNAANDAAEKTKKETLSAVKNGLRTSRNVGKFIANGAESLIGLTGEVFEWAKNFTTKVTKDFVKLFDNDDRKRIKSDVPPVWIVHRATGNYVYCVDCYDGKTDIRVRPRAGGEPEEWQIIPANDENYMYVVSKADGRNIHFRGDKEGEAEILMRKHATEDKFKEKIRLLPASSDYRYFYLQYKKREFYIAVDGSGKLYPTFNRSKAAQFEILRPGDEAREAQIAEQEAQKAAAAAAAAVRQARQQELDQAKARKEKAELEKAQKEDQIRKEYEEQLRLAAQQLREAEEAARRARAEAEKKAREANQTAVNNAKQIPGQLAPKGRLPIPGQYDQTTAILRVPEQAGVLMRFGGNTLRWDKTGNLSAALMNGENWSSDTGNKGNELLWQNDGDLVILNNGVKVWSTGTSDQEHSGKGGRRISFKNNNRLIISNSDNTTIWQSHASKLPDASPNIPPSEMQKGQLPIPDEYDWGTANLGVYEQGVILKNGEYTLNWGSRGLELFKGRQKIWDWELFNTNKFYNLRNEFLSWQKNGNLVIQNQGQIVWSTNTADENNNGNGGTLLRLTNAGQLQILDKNGQVIWQRSEDYRPNELTTGFYKKGRVEENLEADENSKILENGPFSLVWQKGKLIVLNGNEPVWESGTEGRGKQLSFSNGHLTISGNRGEIWSTRSDESYRDSDNILRLRNDGTLMIIPKEKAQSDSRSLPQTVWHNKMGFAPQAKGGLPAPNQPWRTTSTISAEEEGTLLVNGSYRLNWEKGNLVLLKDQKTIWKALINNEDKESFLRMDNEYLEIIPRYGSNAPLWSTRKDDQSQHYGNNIQLTLKEDGNLVLSSNDEVIWDRTMNTPPSQLEKEFFPVAGQPWRTERNRSEPLKASDGDRVMLKNGNYELKWLATGNLVISEGKNNIWETKTQDEEAELYWTRNGEFYISSFRSNKLWEPQINDRFRYQGETLLLREDGKLVITNHNNEEIWQSRDKDEKEDSQPLQRVDNQLLPLPDKVGQTTSEKISYENSGLLLKTREYGLYWEEGNLLIKRLEGFDVIWRTDYAPCYECELYWDGGNLVIGEKYGGRRWQSRTRSQGYSLELTEQGQLRILDEFGNEIWQN